MKRLLLIVAVIALLSPAAFGQSQAIITANVPFDFYAGQTRMPAGEYRVSFYGSTGDILLVANHEDGKVVAIMSYREGSRNEGQNPKLVFHAYGENYFLARVLMSANDLRELPQTRDEREFSTQVHPEEVTVVARFNK
jgi:hypothetical protein